jgi:4'-phosphopantetheinyl transferase
MLPKYEREKSERFRLELLRTRHIKCHFLTRWLLGQYLGVDFYNQEFNRNEHGKPSLENERDSNSIYFNISNSENICVFAYTKDGDLGVDVEKIHDLPDMDRIVERFFSPAENEIFCSLPDHDKKTYFFKYWTRKEALLKAMGRGLSFPPDEVNVAFDKSDETSEFFIKTNETNAEREWTLHDISVFDGFASALALDGKHPDCSKRLRYFQLN